MAQFSLHSVSFTSLQPDAFERIFLVIKFPNLHFVISKVCGICPVGMHTFVFFSKYRNHSAVSQGRFIRIYRYSEWFGNLCETKTLIGRSLLSG